MPRSSFTDDSRSDAGRGSKYPRLSLDQGQRARVAVVEMPAKVYTHRLARPKIVNFAPVYKQVKAQDGSMQWVVEQVFISNAICLGQEEIIKERGADEGSCISCAMARERPDIFRLPQARFAMNVVSYNLRPGGGWTDLTNPPGVQVLVWAFSGKVMDKIIDIQGIYGDVRQHDLLLQCDDKNYQKPYSMGEFMAAPEAVWLADASWQQYVAARLESDAAPEADLIEMSGKAVKPDWMADDVSRIIQAWDVVRAYESRAQGGGTQQQMGGPGFGAETLGQGLHNLQQSYQQAGPPQQAQYPPGVMPAPGQVAPPPQVPSMPGMPEQPAAAAAPNMPPPPQVPQPATAAVAPGASDPFAGLNLGNLGASSAVPAAPVTAPPAVAPPAAPMAAPPATAAAAPLAAGLPPGLSEYTAAGTSNPGPPAAPPAPALADPATAIPGVPPMPSPPAPGPALPVPGGPPAAANGTPGGGGRFNFDDLVKPQGS